MENIFNYFGFSDFKRDQSGTFSGNEISFTELNDTHFLIFEKKTSSYNLYVSRYKEKNEIGLNPPQILELLIKNYDKSIPEHRVAIRRYFE